MVVILHLYLAILCHCDNFTSLLGCFVFLSGRFACLLMSVCLIILILCVFKVVLHLSVLALHVFEVVSSLSGYFDFICSRLIDLPTRNYNSHYRGSGPGPPLTPVIHICPKFLFVSNFQIYLLLGYNMVEI